MMMQLGADGVFIGSGIFKSGDPAQRARACVEATAYFDDAERIAKVSRGLGRGHGRHRRRPARAPASCWPRAVGSAPAGAASRASGCWPCRATSASTTRRCAPSGPTPVAVRRSGAPRRLDGLVLPGRASRRRSAGCSASSSCSSRCARGRGGLPVYGSCAGHGPARRRGARRAGPTSRGGRARRRRAPQRLRPAGRRFETDLAFDRASATRARRLHPGAVGRAHGETVEVLARVPAGSPPRVGSSRSGRATCWPRRSTRS
jgi:hypothetical protein